jgi:ANTAR domain
MPATAGRSLTSSGQSLIQIGIPPGTPREAEVAINRLVELTAILARRAGQLQQALDSRIVIEQAKGVLAERYGITVEEAFRILRRSARSHRIRLHELAELVVESPCTPPQIRTPTLNGR